MDGEGAFSESADRIEDIVRALCPDEGTCFLVVDFDIVHDGSSELRDAGVRPSTEGLLGQQREESLHEVEPGGVRRREVQNESTILLQETLDGRGLMGRQVVENDVNLEALRHVRIELSEETNDIDRSVLPLGASEDLPRCYIESREQVECPMSNVVCVRRSGRPISIGNIGCARSSATTPDFSSKQ